MNDVQTLNLNKYTKTLRFLSEKYDFTVGAFKEKMMCHDINDPAHDEMHHVIVVDEDDQGSLMLLESIMSEWITEAKGNLSDEHEMCETIES